LAAAVLAVTLGTMPLAGCGAAVPPDLGRAKPLEFEQLWDADDWEARQPGPRIVVVEDDAELARFRPDPDWWDSAGVDLDYDLGRPERIPPAMTALWFYAGDLPDGCGRSEVTGVYDDAGEWVVAVRLYKPGGSGGCSDAMVPVSGIVLVEAEKPERVSLAVLNETPLGDGWSKAPQAAS
jgi:hypothetical protein